VFPDPLPRWRNVDRWPDADARKRAFAAALRQIAASTLVGASA
jgi:hypothetical protein